ncbi:hypothetical protein [Rossellomorea sp. NS-SX7]
MTEDSKKYVWLPFTRMKDDDENPIILESSEGINVKDMNGNEH